MVDKAWDVFVQEQQRSGQERTPPCALRWPELMARLNRQQGHSKQTKHALCKSLGAYCCASGAHCCGLQAEAWDGMHVCATAMSSTAFPATSILYATIIGALLLLLLVQQPTGGGASLLPF